MGCCESCFPSTASSIPSEAVVSSSTSLLLKNETYQSTELPDFHATAGELQDEKYALEFDPNCSVFEGTEVLQKFTNKSTYDTKFVWVNIHSRTIHMSQYMTKDRRHKEASLTDVTSVVAGPPVKSKRSSLSGANGDVVDANCLTINFKRGGGIDLQFKTETERILWFSTLKKIILQNGSITTADE